MNDDTGNEAGPDAGAEVHESVTFSRLMTMLESGSEGGCCIRCGVDAPELGPEASTEWCAECGEHAAYGAEELMIKKLFHP